jgi:hypothetical protein
MNNSSINSLIQVKNKNISYKHSKFINNDLLHIDTDNSTSSSINQIDDSTLANYDIFYILLNIINFISLLIHICITVFSFIVSILIKIFNNHHNHHNHHNHSNNNNNKINLNILDNTNRNNINTDVLIKHKAKQLMNNNNYKSKNNIIFDIITEHNTHRNNTRSSLEQLFLNK